MRLLIFTQKIDKNDQVLGFFHDWVKKISQRFDSTIVICIEEGVYNLPESVTVFSLGKQYGIYKVKYIINFWRILFEISGKYEKVFVHMNQEYVLLGWLYWWIKKIPIYLWRNHLKGNLLTYLSVLISKKVFYTSRSSYTARFGKSIQMPVGIDTEVFKPKENIVRKKYSVGMVGRVSPVKNIDLGLKAIKILVDRGVQVNMTILGPVLENDKEYLDGLKIYANENNLSKFISFSEGVDFNTLPDIYSSLEICLNLTEAGSFDKTIVEATSCGAMPLVINESLKGILPDICITQKNEKNIADSIERLLQAGEQVKIHKNLLNFVNENSLDLLVGKIFDVIKNNV